MLIKISDTVLFSLVLIMRTPLIHAFESNSVLRNVRGTGSRWGMKGGGQGHKKIVFQFSTRAVSRKWIGRAILLLP